MLNAWVCRWAATCSSFAMAAERVHLSVSSLSKRIAELEAARESLDRLAVRGEPFLPPQVTRMQQQMRALGVSERTLQMERDAWLLCMAQAFQDVLPAGAARDAFWQRVADLADFLRNRDV